MRGLADECEIKLAKKREDLLVVRTQVERVFASSMNTPALNLRGFRLGGSCSN